MCCIEHNGRSAQAQALATFGSENLRLNLYTPTLPTVFMFSGQGSQYYAMGRELRTIHYFEQTLCELDEVCRAMLGESVVAHVYDPNYAISDPFKQTLLSHPAIFIVELALAKTLIYCGVVPQYVLGTSLGSFAAAVVAQCIDEEQAMKAVIKQAEVIDSCPAGSMIAVMDHVDLYYNNRDLSSLSDLAGTNFDSHFVVSLPKEYECDLGEVLAGTTFQVLPVSHAFHSRWIDQAALPYLDYLKGLNISCAQVPLLCSLSTSITDTLSDRFFWDVIRKPILFYDLIDFIEKNQNFRYIDCGPSGTLTTFLKYALPAHSHSHTHTVMSQYGKEAKKIRSLVDQEKASAQDQLKGC